MHKIYEVMSKSDAYYPSIRYETMDFRYRLGIIRTMLKIYEIMSKSDAYYPSIRYETIDFMHRTYDA